MDQTQWKLEEAHLKQVYDKICRELERRGREVGNYRKTVRKTRRTIWEEADHTWERGDIDAAVEIKQYMDVLRQESRNYEIAQRQLSKLELLERSPYFGRIDFTEKGLPDTEQIYIGITSFFDEQGNILIYDWRAPVSSIFYDFELGQVYYMCPEGKIEGTVSLKRQYRIFRDRLEYMLDTGVKIDDEVLQEILSQSTDEKMRNIVKTIQSEQNRIIRDENHQLLMVQGVAGSGKTSIALHRIAYLLYQYRDSEMTSRNILIFSPNTVFNDYISNVLPELGEENMQQTTFDEYLDKVTEKDLSFERSSDHMEYVLTAGNTEARQTRLKGIAYKSSMAFYQLLNDYAGYLEHHSVLIDDITFQGRVIVPRKEIERLFYEDYASMPLAGRLEKVKQRLYYLIRPSWYRRRRELEEELSHDPSYKGRIRAYSRLFVYREFKPVRQQIEDMLHFDTYQVFLNLFEDSSLFARLAGDHLPDDYESICNDTAAWIREKMLGYEDISAYIYLKGMLEGVPRMRHIRHVVVDEAQDYTPVQYGILKQLFPKTKMTLLGDFNQAIHPLKSEFRYEQISDILLPDSRAILHLTKGYRSTSDIADFTRSILKESSIESVQRRGAAPQLILADHETLLLDRLVSDIKQMVKEGRESIGVLCKTAKRSRELYNRIKSRLQATLLTQDDVNFSRGIIVLPVYLAKGLEFDGAMVFDADEQTYGREQDRKLFYTACTRALHRLHLYCSAQVSPFMKDIPEDYYETIHL
ncbi:MAG: RNA polymerase recycling motor HelD [Caldicoprobacterales bacterium]|nr:UvrD-helicase domain-containing protein [Clostridiales bacterium]